MKAESVRDSALPKEHFHTKHQVSICTTKNTALRHFEGHQMRKQGSYPPSSSLGHSVKGILRCFRAQIYASVGCYETHARTHARATVLVAEERRFPPPACFNSGKEVGFEAYLGRKIVFVRLLWSTGCWGAAELIGDGISKSHKKF